MVNQREPDYQAKDAIAYDPAFPLIVLAWATRATSIFA